VGSLKLYQYYLIDFINSFPGHNIPQTFIAYTSGVTTGHDDINKIKTMFFGVNLLHYLRLYSFLRDSTYNIHCVLTVCPDTHPPLSTDLHKTNQ